MLDAIQLIRLSGGGLVGHGKQPGILYCMSSSCDSCCCTSSLAMHQRLICSVTLNLTCTLRLPPYSCGVYTLKITSGWWYQTSRDHQRLFAPSLCTTSTRQVCDMQSNDASLCDCISTACNRHWGECLSAYSLSMRGLTHPGGLVQVFLCRCFCAVL